MISILTVNSGPTYPEHEQSIRENTRLDYEYLVRDNSRDNIGFARANNELITKSTGDSIVLLNPDTFVTQNWLSPLVKAAKGDVGIVQPRLVNVDMSLQSTGHEWKKRWAVPTVRERTIEPIDGNYEIPSACFAAVLIPRRVIDSVGLMDEGYFLYFEDVDYCLRARRKGWRIMYCPQSTIVHVGHGSTKGKPLTDIASISYHRFLRKWYPSRYYLKRCMEQYVRAKRVLGKN